MWLCVNRVTALRRQVKGRTASVLPHDRNNMTFLPPSQPPPPPLTQQTAASEEVPPAACRRATKQKRWACGHQSEAKHCVIPHISAPLHLFLPPGSHPRLFFIRGKAETCRVCFSPSLGWVPTFSSPGVSELRVIFQKNTRWISRIEPRRKKLFYILNTFERLRPVTHGFFICWCVVCLHPWHRCGTLCSSFIFAIRRLSFGLDPTIR